MMDDLQQLVERYAQMKHKTRVYGAVTEVLPSHCAVEGLSEFVKVGDCVEIGEEPTLSLAQVVRVGRKQALVKSFDNGAVVGLGTPVRRIGAIEIAPHSSWTGRALNAFGRPIDEKGPLRLGDRRYCVDGAPPSPLRRARVAAAVRTGVRAIDCFTPICNGQRLGIFAGSGVGKSTLLSMIARAPGFEICVICLVGERGREVRDFLDEVAKARSAGVIAVVATGDESPMMRRLAPNTATTIAEFFRDAGASVLLIVDSVTRYAHAAREVSLAAGEPPVAHGYTPSVFADLPRLLERAGPGLDEGAAITGIFSVLVDGDNHNDPIADCIRGTLDGHIVLDREIAEQGRYPAINVLKSISRLADRVWSPEQKELAQRLRALMSRYEETRDLRMLGAYQPGGDAQLDQAVALTPLLYAALRQSPDAPPSVNAFSEIAASLSAPQAS
jgi:flagellum-specific ATP synthase